MSLMENFVKVMIVLAGLAASKSASPSQRRFAEGEIIHIENSDGYCLTTRGDAFIWGSCNLPLRLVAPRDPSEANILRAADSWSCLAFEPYGRTGFPVLRLTPCREWDSNQQWQLDYSYGRDRRNQIRSMTSLGVCQEHPDTWNGDHPEYVSCPIEACGPICIGVDDNRAVARPCKDEFQSTEANAVRNYQSSSIGGSTFNKFQKALRNGAPPGVDKYFIGEVLHAHNDESVTYDYDTTVDFMIIECLAYCERIGCDEFDAVYDKRACFFSTSGGDYPSELKLDFEAAAFFMN